MTTTLRTFLDEREAAIKEQLKALRAELAEIKVTRQALGGSSPEVSPPTNPSGPTIKDMVRAVLKEAPAGMTSSEILTAIKAEYGKDLERTSLSPQLSRLKGDLEVHLSGDTWYTVANWHQRNMSPNDLPEQPDVRGGEDDDFEDLLGG